MKARFHIIITLLSMTLLASCGKDYDRFSRNMIGVDTTWKSPTAMSADLQNLFQQIAVKPQTLEVQDIALPDTLLFNGPAAVAIPERGCQAPGGAAVSGAATVELTLLRTKGEFIRNSKPSCADRAPVMSRAIMNVRILQNGKELQLKQGSSISITYADAVPDPTVTAFYAEGPSPDRPYEEWVPALDGTNASNYLRPPYGGILGSTPAGYTVKFAQLRWVNCGSYGDTSRRDHMSLTLPLGFTNANTAVFLVPRDLPTVIQLDAEPRHQYFHTAKVPDGQALKAVTISYINGSYYLGTADATSAEGMNIVVKPERTTLSEMLNFLETL